MVQTLVQESASKEDLKTYEQQVCWEMIREDDNGKVVERDVERAGDTVIVKAEDRDYANDLGTDNINPSLRDEDWEKGEKWIIDGENSWLRELEFVVVKTRIYEDYEDWKKRKIVKEGFAHEEDAEEWMENYVEDNGFDERRYRVVRRPNNDQRFLSDDLKKKCHICKREFKSEGGMKSHRTKMHMDRYTYEGEME